VDLTDKTIVVTGAGNGIGAALCVRFARDRPRGLIAADCDAAAAQTTAAATGGTPICVDVADETAMAAMIAGVEAEYGPIDLLCMNAGIATSGDMTASNAAWQHAWEVNVMSHVYAVRAALPAMLERGSGYLLHTASAAGLLSSIGAAPYAVTKHAVVALAEWLSITYGSLGITVSCLSPQFVRTAMLGYAEQVSPEYADFAAAGSISVESLAEAVVAGIREERFHILPHPEVASFFATRATEPERWLAAMRGLQNSLNASPRIPPPARPQ
jgi:NAD(P)-dependent dehydrogenase (short-subunit alcohol dehydrogenase family)